MNTLKERRESLGLTRQQMACGLDMSKQGYINAEDGQSMPRLDTLQRMAAFFGVSIEELFPSSVRQEEP